MFSWSPYVSVAERKAKAIKKINQLRKKGKTIYPVELQTRTIVTKFWGKLWCKHLESFSDFENRLPRGRTYVRNGSVCHLEIKKGCVDAIVSGGDLYNVHIKVEELSSTIWNKIKKKCLNQIGSVLELLRGKISDHVMKVIADQDAGLFPKADEIKFECDCPDWAYMCKHVAAVLFGIGHRLDSEPELLFQLRNVDVTQLTNMDLSHSIEKSDNELLGNNLSDIFGVEFDEIKKESFVDKPKKIKKKSKARVKRNSFKISSFQLIKTRKKLAFSVSEFAKIAGVSSASVYRWENSKGTLNLQKRSKKNIKRLMKKDD
ncbi:MAG: hypothetical protein KR126chlam5_00168 [Candidatus Anoxychlamydiales bacterium]|nr:hypothetical protein [Candidatus Anoxychlamydiales bacterium]